MLCMFVTFVLQTLGEMVIGAYKHAGRKRMAFKAGSMMAEFHKCVVLLYTMLYVSLPVTSMIFKLYVSICCKKKKKRSRLVG